MEGSLELRERRNMAQGLHEETLLALHMRGQNLYRQKQYQAALQCFTKARTRQWPFGSQLTSLP